MSAATMAATRRAADTLIIFVVILLTWQALHQWVGSTALPAPGSTLAYLVLFVVLRPMGAQTANLLALLSTAVLNTAANRRFTFGVRGSGAARHQLQGLLVFVLGLGLTSGALAALGALIPRPGRVLELSVLVLANLAATALRFVLFREWVFAGRRTRTATEVSR